MQSTRSLADVVEIVGNTYNSKIISLYVSLTSFSVFLRLFTDIYQYKCSVYVSLSYLDLEGWGSPKNTLYTP